MIPKKLRRKLIRLIPPWLVLALAFAAAPAQAAVPDRWEAIDCWDKIANDKQEHHFPDTAYITVLGSGVSGKQYRTASNRVGLIWLEYAVAFDVYHKTWRVRAYKEQGTIRCHTFGKPTFHKGPWPGGLLPG